MALNDWVKFAPGPQGPWPFLTTYLSSLARDLHSPPSLASLQLPCGGGGPKSPAAPAQITRTPVGTPARGSFPDKRHLPQITEAYQPVILLSKTTLLVIKGLCGAASAWPRWELLASFPTPTLPLLLTTNVWPLQGQTSPLAASLSQSPCSASPPPLPPSARGPFVPFVGLPQEERKGAETG